jgi:replication initiation and membrane attachment protein DnaB
MIDGALSTIIGHVDNLRLSYIKIDTLKEEAKWLESLYEPLVGQSAISIPILL